MLSVAGDRETKLVADDLSVHPLNVPVGAACQQLPEIRLLAGHLRIVEFTLPFLWLHQVAGGVHFDEGAVLRDQEKLSADVADKG